MSEKSGSGLIQLTGLWKGTDKNGNPTLTGTLGGARVMIFKNNYKKEDKHPDYIVYLAEQQKKDEKGKAEEPAQF
jgi:hypothetical protein